MRQTRMAGLSSAVVIVAVALLAWAPGAALAQDPAAAMKMPAGVQTHKLPDGTTILTDAKGMTLYTFQKDAPGKSNCNGPCAQNWPPLMAAADAAPMGEWTIVTRDDGSKMWAYKTMPLYTWVKDTKPGDTTGDGVGNGAWKIAVP